MELVYPSQDAKGLSHCVPPNFKMAFKVQYPYRLQSPFSPSSGRSARRAPFFLCYFLGNLIIIAHTLGCASSVKLFALYFRGDQFWSGSLPAGAKHGQALSTQAGSANPKKRRIRIIKSATTLSKVWTCFVASISFIY